MRGDMELLDEVDADQATDLLDAAADHGRWELVLGLDERGERVRTSGRTPLHLAAGAGELDVVRALLDHGGDPTATDPVFEATPLGWARYLGQPATAEVLEARAPEG
jgi:ankyrin repeat protein